MDGTTALVVAVITLSIVFLVIAFRFKNVKANITSPLVKSEFAGSNEEKMDSSGEVNLSNIKGKNVKAGNIVGAKGKGHSSGSVRIKDVNAQEDISFGDVIGLDNTDKDK